jgi:hypothetical protein
MTRELILGPRRRWAAVTALVLAASLSPVLGGAPVAHATLPGPVIQQGEGFDSAALPSTADMSDWWPTTPYSSYGFYLGGENSAGTNPGHDWLASVMSTGFGVIPIWVGPQSACADQSGLASFSNTPSTAGTQGEQQADDAIAAAQADGFGTVYIYYDLEAFDTGNSACATAAAEFINGWTYEIQQHGDGAGLYGSSEGSDLEYIETAHSNVVNVIWPAEYGYSDYATSPIQGIPNNAWTSHQRIHQWSGGTALRFYSGDSGPGWTLDEDCLDGRTQRTAAWSEACQ